MTYSLVDFLSDPLLRAPMWGSLFMCLASSWIGVIVMIRKQSLVGETLSHAAYPGVVLGAWGFAMVSSFLPEEGFSLFLLGGAFLCSWMGLYFLKALQERLHIKSDAALCFVLSSFFGVGVLLASRMQYVHALWYKQIQAFLYGQTATMTDIHIGIYGALCLGVLAFLALFYRVIQVTNFDRLFAQSLGFATSRMDALFFLLLVLAVTIAIRSVGVVLLSGMLIAPALSARQFVHSLSSLFMLSGCFGAVSALMGNYCAIYSYLPIPAGPMIVLCSTMLCILSLFFAPKRGLILRLLRKRRFSASCIEENLLKALWKCFPKGKTWEELKSYGSVTQRRLHRLCRQGWIVRSDGQYVLSKDGEVRAGHIVRLHRLWEVYLVHLGQTAEKVHASAEEMEHVITPELEKRLSDYLNHPKVDPHHQPIPPKR